MEQRDVMLGPGTYFVVVKIRDDMGNTALAKTACKVELPTEVEDIAAVEGRFKELEETNDADAILGFVSAQVDVRNMQTATDVPAGDEVAPAEDPEAGAKLVSLGMSALRTSRSFATKSADSTMKQAKLVEALTDVLPTDAENNQDQLGDLADALFGEDSILADQSSDTGESAQLDLGAALSMMRAVDKILVERFDTEPLADFSAK